jgi:hypothetical protein
LELAAARRRCFGVSSSQKEMFWSHKHLEEDVLELPPAARRRCFGGLRDQKCTRITEWSAMDILQVTVVRIGDKKLSLA